MYTHPRFSHTGPILVWAVICSGLGIFFQNVRTTGPGSGDTAAVFFWLGALLLVAGLVLLCVGAWRIGRVVDAHSGQIIAGPPQWATPPAYPAPGIPPTR